MIISSNYTTIIMFTIHFLQLYSHVRATQTFSESCLIQFTRILIYSGISEIWKVNPRKVDRMFC
jgi:hypothetical protein